MSSEGGPDGSSAADHQSNRQALLAEAEAKDQRRIQEGVPNDPDELRSAQLAKLEQERLEQLARLNKNEIAPDLKDI